MRFLILIIFILTVSTLEFCTNETQEINLNVSAQEIAIDSTNYYDSLYAPLKKSIDSVFYKKFTKRQFNGSFLFAKKGRVIINKAYGYTDLKTKDSLSLANTFQLASASKPFTAIAILQLYEKGLINLNDSISHFFPEFPFRGIDIHQLLCHRSGLSQYTHFCDAPDSIWPDKKQTIHNNDVIEIISKIVPLINYPPNKKYYYCNTNYILLASIIEKVSEMKFEDYLQKNIFDPLGMNSTKVFKRDNFDELVQPVRGHVSSKLYADNTYLNGCVGDKGIYSNVKDLFAFDRALHNHSLIKEETYELAIKEHNEMFKVNQNYGYGFRLIHTESKGKIVFHTGWWKGFRSYFIRVIENDETIIVLDNVKRGSFLDIENLANLIPEKSH